MNQSSDDIPQELERLTDIAEPVSDVPSTPIPPENAELLTDRDPESNVGGLAGNVREWKSSRGYLEAYPDSSSLQFEYESYSDDILEQLSDAGDSLAQITLAWRYQMYEDKRDRVEELYYAAAIDGKTAGLTALGTFGLTDKVYGKNVVQRITDDGSLTDEYAEYLSYFAAAELTKDPVGGKLLDYNVSPDHKEIVNANIEFICKRAQSILDDIAAKRAALGKQPVEYSQLPAAVMSENNRWQHCKW